MNLVKIICRDGVVNAIKEELEHIEYFKCCLFSGFSDKEIFLPFITSIVINFLNFTNKNYELVDFSKLKNIREFLSFDYQKEYDLLDSASDYAFIRGDNNLIINDIIDIADKNHVNFDNIEELLSFVLPFFVIIKEERTKILLIDMKNEQLKKRKYDSELAKKRYYISNIIMVIGTGYSVQLSKKYLEMNTKISNGIVDEYYRKYPFLKIKPLI